MAPTTVQDVPDHLLHRVFRLLDTHDSVVRAAAVCTRWRCMASTHGLDMCWFRHDFSTVIGHYYAVDPSFSPSPGPKKKKKKPSLELSEQPQRRRHRVVFVPASPSIKPRHFSLDFLPISPDGRPWELVDGCGSLLLLASQRRDLFPDLVVCEPISRSFIRIWLIPDMKYSRCLGAFLSYRYNVITISCFRVTCVLHDRAEGMADGVSAVTARVFDREVPPIPNCWKRSCWGLSRTACSSSCFYLRGVESARCAGRAWNWNFWWIEEDGTVLSHRISDSKFKHFHLPEHVVVEESPSPQQTLTTTFRFVESTTPPGGVLLVSLVGDELRVFANSEYHHAGASEWVYERSLQLPEATRGLPGHKECYFGRTGKIVTAGMGYVVLTPVEETWVFSVDLGTMQAEREHVRNRLPGKVYPYKLETRPKVHACLVRCKMRRRGRCTESCKCN